MQSGWHSYMTSAETSVIRPDCGASLPSKVARTDSLGMSNRPSAPRGVLLAAVGAFAALVALWLPWYTIKFPESFRDALGSIGSGATGTGATGSSAAGGAAGAFSGIFKGLAAALPSEITGKGWQVMSGGDVAIAVAAGAALLLIVAVGGGASGVRIERGIAGRLIALAGAVVTAIAVEHVINKPGGGAGSFSSIVQIKYGVAVAAAGGLLMIIGGLLTTRLPQPEAAEPMTPTFEPPQPAVVPDPFAAPAPEHEEHSVSDPFAAPTPESHDHADPFADPVAPQPQVAFDPFADPEPEPETPPRIVFDSEPQVVLDRDGFPEPTPEPEIVLDRDGFPEPAPEPRIVIDTEPEVVVHRDPFADPDTESRVTLDHDPFADPEPAPAPAPAVGYNADPFADPEPAPAVAHNADPFADPEPEPTVAHDADPFADPAPFQAPDPEPYTVSTPVSEPVADADPQAPAEAAPRDWSGFTTPAPVGAAHASAHAAEDSTPEPTVPRPAGVSIPPPGWTGAA